MNINQCSGSLPVTTGCGTADPLSGDQPLLHGHNEAYTKTVKKPRGRPKGWCPSDARQIHGQRQCRGVPAKSGTCNVCRCDLFDSTAHGVPEHSFPLSKMARSHTTWTSGDRSRRITLATLIGLAAESANESEFRAGPQGHRGQGDTKRYVHSHSARL